jgi:hypothetical protein
MLTDDLFTPRDSTFNELLRQVHTSVADKLVESTDVTDKITKILGLKKLDEKGKPEIGQLQDVGTSVFMPPEEEPTDEGLESAPEETPELGLPGETPSGPPGLSDLGAPPEPSAPEAPSPEGPPLEAPPAAG